LYCGKENLSIHKRKKRTESEIYRVNRLFKDGKERKV
jgi:hypothetical protein